MNYKIQFLDDEAFDSLPAWNVQEKMGMAYPETGEAFVRKSGSKVVDIFTAIHELEHLEGESLSEHYDPVNHCYYKSKSNFFNQINPFGGNFGGNTLHPYIAPILSTVAAIAAPQLLPAIGSALSGVGSTVSGALGSISPALGGAAQAIGAPIAGAGNAIGGAFGLAPPTSSPSPFGSTGGIGEGLGTLPKVSGELKDAGLGNLLGQAGKGASGVMDVFGTPSVSGALGEPGLSGVQAAAQTGQIGQSFGGLGANNMLAAMGGPNQFSQGAAAASNSPTVSPNVSAGGLGLGAGPSLGGSALSGGGVGNNVINDLLSKSIMSQFQQPLQMPNLQVPFIQPSGFDNNRNFNIPNQIPGGSGVGISGFFGGAPSGGGGSMVARIRQWLAAQEQNPASFALQPQMAQAQIGGR